MVWKAAMQVPLAVTIEWKLIILTDEHPCCMAQSIPCVTVGTGPLAIAMGRLDRIKTPQGLYDCARLVYEWIKTSPDRNRDSMALAIRFLERCPEYL